MEKTASDAAGKNNNAHPFSYCRSLSP